MKTEIIAVGTELLLGQIVNTNASYLSEKLAPIGYEVYYHSVVGDNPKRLAETLAIAHRRSELVILCGGLGPTEDDLTKEAVAEFIGTTLETDQEALAKLEARIKVTNRVLTPNNLKQAQYLAGGEVIKNDRGLAIGSLVTFEEVKYLLLPGPPSELHWMVDQYVVPRLQEYLPTTSHLTSKVLRFYGIGESTLATELGPLIDQQSNPTIALYAKDNEVTVRLTAKGETVKGNNQLIDMMEQKILAVSGAYFYGYGEENSLVKECLNVLSSLSLNDKTMLIHDYFSDGRIGLEWQKEAGSRVTIQTIASRLTSKSLAHPVAGEVAIEELTETVATRIHSKFLPHNDPTLSVLIIGQVEKSQHGDFFEGNSVLSVRYNEQEYTKKTVYAGNEDTIKDRSVLETTEFIREIIKIN